MIGRWLRDGIPAGGLSAGAAAWLVSTQLNYALVPWVCATGITWATPILSAVLMLVSLAGGFLSWLAWDNADVPPAKESAVAQPRRLLAGIGIMSAALFALVIVSQGSAAFVLQGCER
jgi:hypothetical protein